MFHLFYKDLNKIEDDELYKIHTQIRAIQQLLEGARMIIHRRMSKKDTPNDHEVIKYQIGAIIDQIRGMGEEARKALMAELQAEENYQRAKKERRYKE